jgi:hypothetical protein
LRICGVPTSIAAAAIAGYIRTTSLCSARSTIFIAAPIFRPPLSVVTDASSAFFTFTTRSGCVT